MMFQAMKQRKNTVSRTLFCTTLIMKGKHSLMLTAGVCCTHSEYYTQQTQHSTLLMKLFPSKWKAERPTSEWNFKQAKACWLFWPLHAWRSLGSLSLALLLRCHWSITLQRVMLIKHSYRSFYFCPTRKWNCLVNKMTGLKNFYSSNLDY